MDILKFGPDVEVLEPESLRSAIASGAAATTRNYRSAKAHAMIAK